MEPAHKRKFNKAAYKATDKACKDATINVMKAQGYDFHSDPNVETFKKYDLEFYNSNTGKSIKIENEMRENYNLLKAKYSSIHIPIRKKNTEADYYLVWKSSLDEFALIEKKFLTSSPIVEVDCRARGQIPSYTERMIDVQKNDIIFYQKQGKVWKICGSSIQKT